MTDKEKRELKDGVKNLIGKYKVLEHGIIEVLENNILFFIDSMQEEPVSSIWHDASEKSNEPEGVVIINPSDNTGDVLTRCTGVYQGRIWAYTSELLKLSNLERIGKNWKEPVSEELEEASKEWLRPQLDKSYANYGEAKMMELTHFDGYAMIDAIEFGAKWQKEQIKKAMDLGEPPYLISIEQAYYRTLKLLEE